MTIGSISAFARVRGGYTQGNRDVYFLRILGANDTTKQEIQEIDHFLSTAMQQKQLYYQRLRHLPLDMQAEEREFYAQCYENWMDSDCTVMRIHAEQDNDAFCQALGAALKTMQSAYDQYKAGNTASMQRNFMIKLMKWTDIIWKENPIPWTERSCIKIVAENVEKVQEYLFYDMLTLLGADVMLMQTKQDVVLPDWLEAHSKKMVLGAYVTWDLPEKIQTPDIPKVKSCLDDKKKNPSTPIHITLPERARKDNSTKVSTKAETVSVTKDKAVTAMGRREKSFEELALLASSIVMITIHDQTGEPIGSGSGIMIGEDGYILTNYHVVRGGYFYSVQIEEDDTVYPTDELIKYHSVEDLAIIRIDRKLNPLPIYQGKENLVRGQKVVAIGSPLGLFNSVSDGIISGFRTIDTVDMMQFTAPISHGSSGGAVLNMFGEVIGISTAGIDHGQNINLAVLYKNILVFTRGFC